MSRILNSTKVLVFIIAILLIANISILIFFLADRHPDKKNEERNIKDRYGFSEFLRKDIKFSDSQIKQYDSLKRVHSKEAKPLFKRMNTLKDSFYIHISDSVISDQFLMQAADSIGENQQRMDLDMFSHFRKIRNLCTDDQKPRFDSLAQDIIKKMMNPYRRDIRPKNPDQGKRPGPDSAKGKH